MKEKLSVVIPCYNSEKNIENVINRDMEIFREQGVINFEFVLVNDCSSDGTWNVLTDLSQKYKNIVAINLAKNCGQHNAIMAGFHYATGDYVVVSDDDGQTQMEVISSMVEKLNEGFDVVMTNWEQRGHRSLSRRWGTVLNDKVSQVLMDNPDKIPVSIFFLAKRFVIEEVVRYERPYPFVTGLILRTTHNIGVVNVEQLQRQSGQSGYSFRKLLRLWMNGFTAFSILPLRMASYIGTLSALFGFIFGIFVIVRKIVMPQIATGWSSTVAIFMFMSGIILCVLGMIGEYVGRIYMCINNTPQYVIKEIRNEK